MTLPAARLGDPTAHGGVITVGLPTVIIGNMPAARIGDMHVCPMVTGVVPHVGGPLILGSFTVLVGGPPQSRQTDMLICVGPPDMVAMGCPTVLVGMVGAPGGIGLVLAIIGGFLAGLRHFISPYPRAVLQPDGSYVTEYNENIRIEGTPEFQARVVNDLNTLNNTDAGRRLIDSFDGTGRTVTIRESGAANGGCSPANGADATDGTGTNSVVSYNPNFSNMYDSGPTAQGQPGREPWMDTTSPVILGHELVHAQHNAHGTNDFTIEGERMAVGVGAQPGYPNDYSGRDISENALRDDLGQPRRPRYTQFGPP
ncbi:MAG: M91 family zinc metallopeptidase [Pyrinomonadaceae bacterium]